MQKEFGPKGLVVVGVTDEPKSLVGPDVQKKKMKYPVASSVGSDFMTQYGVRGFPTAFLIDADGMVAWTGHPGEFDEGLLTELLTKVQVVPTLPEANADITKLFESRSYGKAWAALQKAQAKAPDDAALKAASESLSSAVKRKLDEATEAVGDGRFGDAQRLYRSLMESFAGVPGAEAAKPAADALKKDAAAKDELAAADRVDTAIEQFKKGEMEKAAKAFASTAKKYPDTPSGKRAAELADLYPLD